MVTSQGGLSMRDVVLTSMVLVMAVMALKRPWIGVMLWTWISTLNPHRFTYGFAFDMPMAAIAAAATLLGLFFTRDRQNPFKGSPAVVLAIFVVWITISWLLGLDVSGDYEQWNKVMKIYLMIFVTLALLHTKGHVIAFIWVIVISLGYLGVKGGAFTIATAGNYRVWGPPQTFIAENNAFAVAVIMTIPLMRFLQLQLTSRVGRWAMTGAMLLMAACALGSQSRGALLALATMSIFLWWRSKRQRVLGALVILVAGVLLVTFMPESWEARMSTLKTYQEDASAMGRIAAWWVAWGIGFDYPFGVGFMAARPELFQAYSPYLHLLGGHTPVAHSIYFQMLGHHGFVGLFLFLAIWFACWRIAGKMRKRAEGVPEARWCADLGGMAQVSLIGYFVGGAFLDLGYFDLPYNIMVAVVVASVWLKREAWKFEPAAKQGFWVIPGLVGPESKVSSAR